VKQIVRIGGDVGDIQWCACLRATSPDFDTPAILGVCEKGEDARNGHGLSDGQYDVCVGAIELILRLRVMRVSLEDDDVASRSAECDGELRKWADRINDEVKGFAVVVIDGDQTGIGRTSASNGHRSSLCRRKARFCNSGCSGYRGRDDAQQAVRVRTLQARGRSGPCGRSAEQLGEVHLR